MSNSESEWNADDDTKHNARQDSDVVGPEKYRLIGNIFVVPGKILDPPEPIRHRSKVNRSETESPNDSDNEASQNPTEDDLRVTGREDLRIAGNTFLIPGKILNPPEPIKHRPKAQRET